MCLFICDQDLCRSQICRSLWGCGGGPVSGIAEWSLRRALLVIFSETCGALTGPRRVKHTIDSEIKPHLHKECIRHSTKKAAEIHHMSFCFISGMMRKMKQIWEEGCWGESNGCRGSVLKNSCWSRAQVQLGPLRPPSIGLQNRRAR